MAPPRPAASTDTAPRPGATGLRLELLGGLRLSRGGAPLAGFAYAKGRALLAYLALTGRPHTREALAALLWGDLPDAAARQNLRAVLTDLRRAAGGHLLITREAVAFDRAAPCWLDVEAFEAALRRPDPGAAPGAPPPLERLRAAAELYRGELLAGFAVHGAPAFDEWLAAQRERLRQLALHALHELAVHSTERGDYAAGIDYATRLLALDPWREDAHRQLMLLLAASGQREAALAQYERCRRVLAEELGAEPDPETAALAARLRAGAAEGPRPPAAAHRSAVPVPPTPLLGRDAELAALARLLTRPDVRLVTIVGPPGVGKTRLALEVAAHRRGDDAGGVCFVDLAPVDDAALVVPAIARALGVREDGRRPLLDDLAAALDDRHVVLVLDNCEQVLGAAPALAHLLALCPRLVLLATSRAPLRVRGEHELALAPLALPDLPRVPLAPGRAGPADAPAPARALDPEALAQYPAVALFVGRAAAVRRDFALTADNARAVAELCVRLDGLPLAIELAAARLRLLPLPALVERLTGRLHVLSVLVGGPRDLPARQQTLRTTIDWSYHLLDDAGQRLLRRLGVFAGGFTLAAAEAVVGGPGPEAGAPTPLPPDGVLEGLERLADAGLLTRVEPVAGDPAGEVRCRLLETIRDYALERLEASGEAAAVRDRHAAWFLALAEQGQPRLYQPGSLAWLERLEQEDGNFRAALQWWTERGDVERALRLGTALAVFWLAWGYRAEGRERLLALLAVPTAQPPPATPATRANAFVAAAVLTGNFPAAAVAAREAAGAAAGGGAPPGAALASPGAAATARGLAAQAAAIWRDRSAATGGGGDGAAEVTTGQSGHDGPAAFARAAALAGAAAHLASVDFAAARALADEAVAIWRRLGQRHAITNVLRDLGLVARDLGEYAAARDLLEEGLAVARDLGYTRGAGLALDRLGTVAHARGDLATARSHYEAALAACAAVGDRALEAWVRLNLGFLALDEGRPAAARALTAEVLGIRQEEGRRAPLVHVVALCAALAAAEGQPERALRLDGALETLWQTMDGRERSVSLPPLYRTWLDRRLASARQALGASAAAAAARTGGAALTAAEALAEAAAYVGGAAERPG